MEWSGIHSTVADALNNHGVFWWHTPNEGKRSVFMGARLKKMGLRKGAPDFFILKNGVLYGLEVKATKKKPTPAQFEFRDLMVADGGKWDWADDVDRALEILRAWGIIPIPLTPLTRKELLQNIISTTPAAAVNLAKLREHLVALGMDTTLVDEMIRRAT